MSLLHDDDGKKSREDPAERCRVPGLSRLEEVCQAGNGCLAQLSWGTIMEIILTQQQKNNKVQVVVH